MLVKSEKSIHIDHVMWQPIFQCVMESKCHDCYVAKSPSSKYQGKINLDLLDYLFDKTSEYKLSCDQLTISLDSLINKPHDDLINKLKWLWSLYNTADDCGCASTTRLIDNKPLPQLCITAFNLNTVDQWASWLSLDLKTFLSPLTVLSLSNFPVQGKKCQELVDLCKLTKTVLNFNKLCEKDIDKTKSFEMGIRYSDQTYLVLKKPALGEEVPEENLDNFFDILFSEEENLLPDVCMLDSRGYLKTGKKCGAGINKIHVWPDNSVTGCPYDSNHILNKTYMKEKSFNLWSQIIDATDRKGCHSMNFCKIPETLKAKQKQK